MLAGGCETTGESHGMSFGDAYVVDAVGHGLLQDVDRSAGGHSRRDAYYIGVCTRQFQQMTTEHLLPLGIVV